MENIADLIERFILSRLSGQDDNFVLLQRNELADELACAPSQISYVLSTRFTEKRGFLVESRRGAGGYIRVVRVLPQNAGYDKKEVAESIFPPRDNIEEIIANLYEQQQLTRRETVLLQMFFAIMRDKMNLPEQIGALRTFLLTLARY